MKRIIAYLAAAAALCTSCIDNDIPYPVVELQILSLEGEGFTVSPSDIDPVTRTVTLRLDETTDIRKVEIVSAELTPGAAASRPLTGTFDLRTPLYVTLSLYQEYEWSISAVQTIERRFAVEGQVSGSEIDAANRIVRASVNVDVDLKNIKVIDLKLGPEGITTYTPSADELTDFESVRFVEVQYHDVRERWMLSLTQIEYTVLLTETDLWKNTAAVAIRLRQAAREVSFAYRRSGEQAWREAEVAASGDGIGFTASIAPTWNARTNEAGLTVYDIDPTTGVFAGRTYEYLLTADGEQVETGTFTTPEGNAIPYGDMEDASLSCFSIENVAAPFWGSGNNSYTTALCTQKTFEGMGGEHCAKLAGAKAPVVGILAAGNLFTGTFKREGFDGTVGFGQDYDWNARPTALRLKYHATIGRVDKTKHDGAGVKQSDQDIAVVFVSVVDWDSRHEVFSGMTGCWGMWSPDMTSSVAEGPIIGYGIMLIDRSTPGDSLVEATIPMQYYDTTAKPGKKYKLVISCSTSYYGDYLAGCTTNELYLDDFEWVY